MGVATACEVVDPGPEVGVAGRCVTDSAYFVERVVPDYLEKYDCRNASDGGCHDIGNGASIYRLRDTNSVLPPSPLDPESSWPEPWQRNLEATAAQITDCDNAALSPLYSEPAGGDTRTHAGGDLFPPGGPELDLLQGWLDAAP